MRKNEKYQQRQQKETKKIESTICRFKMWKSQTALFPFTSEAIENDDVNKNENKKIDAIGTDTRNAAL